MRSNRISIGGGKQVRWLRAADGSLLARLVTAPGKATQREDFLGPFAYTDGTLAYILHDEGRAVPAPSPGRAYRHEYHYRDHLGNLRLAFSDLDRDGIAEPSDILQEAHYYPYGLQHEGIPHPAQGAPSRFTFNGKEQQDALGLNWIDFGARMYDPQTGRWTGVDALAEKYAATSGYGFVMGDPVGLVDVDGRSADRGGDPKRNPVKLPENAKIQFVHTSSVLNEINEELLNATSRVYAVNSIVNPTNSSLGPTSGRNALKDYVVRNAWGEAREESFNAQLEDVSWFGVNEDFELTMSIEAVSWEEIGQATDIDGISTSSTTSRTTSNNTSLSTEIGESEIETSVGTETSSSTGISKSFGLQSQTFHYQGQVKITINGSIDWAGPIDTFWSHSRFSFTYETQAKWSSAFSMEFIENMKQDKKTVKYNIPAQKKTWEGTH